MEPHALEDIQRAERVYLKVESRIHYRCGDGHLCSLVHHKVGTDVGEDSSHIRRQSQIGMVKTKASVAWPLKPFELPKVFPGSIAGKVVENVNLVPLAELPCRHMKPDKAGTTRHQNFTH